MLVGDYGTAKSRVLELLKLTSFNACNLGTAVSSANVYRVQEALSGTQLIDEFESHETDKSNPFVQILNNGYKEGGIIIRSEQKNNAWVPTPFNVFGPKAIATRTLPKDDALISRCFVLKTMRINKNLLHANGIPLDLNAKIKKEAESLRNRLLALRIRDANKPAKFANQLKFKTTMPRDEQLLRSILSVFPEEYQLLLAETLELSLYLGRLTPALKIEVDMACVISQILSEVDDWKNKLPMNFTLKELGEKITKFKNKTYKPRALAAAARRMGFECQRMNTGTVIILDDLNNIESFQDRYLLLAPVG